MMFSLGYTPDRCNSVLGALYAICINIQYGTIFDLAGIMPTGKISKDHARFYMQESGQKIVGTKIAYNSGFSNLAFPNLESPNLAFSNLAFSNLAFSNLAFSNLASPNARAFGPALECKNEVQN
jgi:hypothetical protein